MGNAHSRAVWSWVEPSAADRRCQKTGGGRDLLTMSSRRFKFDTGDWVAVRTPRGEWKLWGKVVDADEESCTVDHHGVRYHYVPGEDPIARVRWTGAGRWTTG